MDDKSSTRWTSGSGWHKGDEHKEIVWEAREREVAGGKWINLIKKTIKKTSSKVFTGSDEIAMYGENL